MYRVIFLLLSSAIHPVSVMSLGTSVNIFNRPEKDCYLRRPSKFSNAFLRADNLHCCWTSDTGSHLTTSLFKTRRRRTLPSRVKLQATGDWNEQRNGHSTNNPKPAEKDPQDRIPRHVGIVLDGNGRWATQRNLPVSIGHAKGAGRVLQLVPRLRAAGVKWCTLYCFSTENWTRPPQEVKDIMSILERTVISIADQAIKQRIRVKLLGSKEMLPPSLVKALEQLDVATDFGRQRINSATMQQQQQQQQQQQYKSSTDASAVVNQQRNGQTTNSCTDSNDMTPNDEGNGDTNADDKLTLCLAINYGGRRDLVEASKRLAQAIRNGEFVLSDINETLLSSYLSTSGIPDPDLIIRTGGEQRLSNFLLWNAAYSELYFTNVLWPDFDEKCFKDALEWYASRERRFGGRNQEQEESSLYHA